MDWLHILQIIATVVVIGAGFGAGYGGFYYAFRSNKAKLLQEQISQLKDDYNQCDVQHKNSLKLIHNLEGKVEVLQTIPLQEIAASLQELKTIATQEVKEQHVQTQVVEQPIVDRRAE